MAWGGAIVLGIGPPKEDFRFGAEGWDRPAWCPTPWRRPTRVHARQHRRPSCGGGAVRRKGCTGQAKNRQGHLRRLLLACKYLKGGRLRCAPKRAFGKTRRVMIAIWDGDVPEHRKNPME